MDQDWEPGVELRLSAAYGTLDWIQAAMTRAVDHIYGTQKPAYFPIAVELQEIARRILGKQNLLQGAYLEERERMIRTTPRHGLGFQSRRIQIPQELTG